MNGTQSKHSVFEPSTVQCIWVYGKNDTANNRIHKASPRERILRRIFGPGPGDLLIPTRILLTVCPRSSDQFYAATTK